MNEREKIATSEIVADALAMRGSGNPTYDSTVAIDALTRAGFEIRPAEWWRPIESAPMDGTLVLLWSPGSVPDVGGMFDSGNKKWWTAHTVPVSPTHWLPLPAPPARGIRAACIVLRRGFTTARARKCGRTERRTAR